MKSPELIRIELRHCEGSLPDQRTKAAKHALMGFPEIKVTTEDEMAIARCEIHPIQRDTKEPYKEYALPLGYPDTAAICGRVGCENPARVWLTPDEIKQHKGGKRVFGVKTHSIRVRVGTTLKSK